jgi:hypothetical protein
VPRPSTSPRAGASQRDLGPEGAIRLVFAWRASLVDVDFGKIRGGHTTGEPVAAGERAA